MKLAKLNSFILPISMPDICIAINVECSQKWFGKPIIWILRATKLASDLSPWSLFENPQ